MRSRSSWEGPFHHFYQASFGAIYPGPERPAGRRPGLRREEPQDGKPDKKIYALSETGRAALLAELSRPPGPDRIRSEFLAQMVFVKLLPDDLGGRRRRRPPRALRSSARRAAGHRSRRLPPGRRFALG